MKSDIEKKNKTLIANIFGAVAAVLFVTSATIVGELVHEFKDWLASTFMHHWVGKGILAIVVFLLVVFVSRGMIKKESDDDVARNFYYLALTAVICSLILLGFFVYEAPSHL